MVGTHRLSRYCWRYVMGFFFSKEIFSVKYQNLLKYHTNVSRQISSIKSHSFTLYFLISNKTYPLKSLLDVQIHIIKKYVPDAPKLYVLQEIRVILCSVYYHLNFTSLVINFLLIVSRMKLQPH